MSATEDPRAEGITLLAARSLCICVSCVSGRAFQYHTTLQRLPLGILDSWSWARPLEEAKESIRWVEGYQRINELQQYLWEQAFDKSLPVTQCPKGKGSKPASCCESIGRSLSR